MVKSIEWIANPASAKRLLLRWVEVGVENVEAFQGRAMPVETG